MLMQTLTIVYMSFVRVKFSFQIREQWYVQFLFLLLLLLLLLSNDFQHYNLAGS